MQITVIAQTKEHQKLIEETWKPSMAYQGFERSRIIGKDGLFKGNDLKAKTVLYVIMERKNDTI